MSRILLDENVPVGLRLLLGAHDVFTVEFQGWKGLANGRLLAAAESARFDVLITGDRNIRFQQGSSGRSLAVVVLSTTRWRDIRMATREIRGAIDRALPGHYETLEIRDPTDDLSPRAPKDR